MVALIRCAETRELIGIRHPVEVAAIHYNATYLRGCTIHIFSGRVSNDVGSPFEWTTVDRGSEGVVYNERYAVLVSNSCKLLNIEHGTAWIADGFTKNYLGIWTESLLDFLLAIVRVYEGALDTEFLQGYTEEIEGATVNLVRGDDVVACLADVEHSVEVGSLTTGSQHCAHATLKLSNLLCHSIISWVLESGIEISLFLQIEEHRHLLRVVIFKCSTLIDWHLNWFAVLWLIASLHAEGSNT